MTKLMEKLIEDLTDACRRMSPAEREYHKTHTYYVIDRCEAPVEFPVDKNLPLDEREKVLKTMVERWQNGTFIVTGFDHEQEMIKVKRRYMGLCCVS